MQSLIDGITETRIPVKPRERVLNTLTRKGTDRPPLFMNVTPQIGRRLVKAVGSHSEEPVDSFFSNRISFPGVLTRLGNDCVAVAATSIIGRPARVLEDGSRIDEWGIRSRSAGWYQEMVGHPLAGVETVKEIESIEFPDPVNPARFRWAEAMIRCYGSTHGIIGEQECTFFELSWYLVGLEKFLMDLAVGEAYVDVLMDRLADYSIRQGCRLIEMGVDVIWAGDDMGNQQGMMISPDLWRRRIKPRLKKVFDAYRSVNPRIFIAYHSCGSIRPIMPDLIEIGLDILNPVQPTAAGMDAHELKSEFGRDLIFFGGIDVQHVLPRGTPADVRKHVRDRISVFGKGGGYIAAPAHNIQPDTPLENIFAMVEAVQGI